MSETATQSDANPNADPKKWTDELLKNPHQAEDKAERVKAMFSAISGSYDLNNRVHSLGIDQKWRKSAVKAAKLKAGDHVLDMACGTGDLSLAFAAAKPQPTRVVGGDFTPAMLEIAEVKKDKTPPAVPVEFVEADAMALQFDDASFDVISIAFGIRNVAQPEKAIAEFHRVLKPGGRLIILEFSLPRFAPIRAAYNFYFRHILPRTASMISRDKSGAYKYLPESVNTYIEREQMLDHLKQAGFESSQVKPLTFGIAVIYSAQKVG